MNFRPGVFTLAAVGIAIGVMTIFVAWGMAISPVVMGVTLLLVMAVSLAFAAWRMPQIRTDPRLKVDEDRVHSHEYANNRIRIDDEAHIEGKLAQGNALTGSRMTVDAEGKPKTTTDTMDDPSVGAHSTEV